MSAQSLSVSQTQAAIEALPSTQQTAMVLGVAAKVLEAVPPGEQRRPSVAALEEMLSEPTRQVTA
ncbi:hypothetical protein K1W54_08600 [Micromonospora sp. CPCC 205371]|nr:hypothetical protein [Micromonospora sp. CPCC 205371]